MKKIENVFSILIFIVYLTSCVNNEKREIKIDEKELVRKLSKNEFYKEFYKYNIMPREEGRVYIISTDSIKEFWVNYDSKKVSLTDADQQSLSAALKINYPRNYLNKKLQILSELNVQITFMNQFGIKSVTNDLDKQRTYFRLITSNEIIRIQKHISVEIESLKRSYKFVTAIDSNWILVNNIEQIN